MKRWLLCFLMMLVPCIALADTPETPLKKASFVYWESGGGNKIFQKSDMARLLKEKFAARGYDLATQDIHKPEKSDVILVAYPAYHVPENMKDKSFLWLLESPLSVTIPAKPDIERRYKKIFTYDQQAAKRPGYVRLPIPYEYRPFSFTLSDLVSKNVLVAQVASHFIHQTPINKYAERHVAAWWFLKNHPDDILLAGHGDWKSDFRNSLPPERQSVFDQRYKGRVKDKIAFLRQAKFGLAYENTQAPDYVSEKIYDVMTAGTVPVYLGAPNIEEYVPQACFINRDDFQSYEELYNFLKNMSDQTYLNYINCIIGFMSDPKNHTNTPEAVTDTLIYEMLDKDVMDNSVEVTLKNGFGNQMFQYAAGLAYARKHGKKLYAPSLSKLKPFFNISASESSKNPHLYSHQSQALQKRLSDRKKSGWNKFDAATYSNPHLTYLSGYMQDEDFFKEFADDIRTEFSFKNPPSANNQKIIDQMKQENSVCLHIRRGDYIRIGYPLLSQTYYDNAIQYIKNHDPDPIHLYIFSNDIEKARQIFKTTEKHTFIHNKQDIEDLRLMTHCRHNIIANSSFSWWGAWLNPNPDKIVVAPDKWDYWHDWWASEIVPPNWVTLPAHDINPAKIAILYIATGRYIRFWNEFYSAMEKYFLPNHEKTYFLFTDDTTLKLPENVIRIPQKQLPWPHIVLSKYHFINNIKDKLKSFDYIYLLNANLIPRRPIDETVLPTPDQGLMFAIHPGFFNARNPDTFPYERNPKSTAAVPAGQGRYYVMGAFTGGTSQAFLKMAETLVDETDQDTRNGIVAKWHDESHLNKYLIQRQNAGDDFLLLPPAYAVPEEALKNDSYPKLAPFKQHPYMILLDKHIRGGHAWFRDQSNIPTKITPSPQIHPTKTSH